MLDNPEEYDKMNSTESELWWYKILHEKVLTVVQERNRSKGIAILDAACGTGGLMKKIIDEGFSNVQGFDISSYAVSIAQIKTEKEVKVLDLKDVNTRYTPKSFDVVVCNDALYFIEESELPALLKKLWSLLKEDGVLISICQHFELLKVCMMLVWLLMNGGHTKDSKA